MPAPDVAGLNMANVAMLTKVLKVYVDQFVSGYGRIHADAVQLLWLLGLIDLALAAAFWMVRRVLPVDEMVGKILAYAFWIFLVGQWITLMPTAINGFIYLGLKAGGSTVTVQEFTNPATVAQLGLVATEPIWKHLRNYGWALALHPFDTILCGILGLWLLAMFLLIAIEIFVYFLEFYIVAVLSSVLIPFGVNRYTGFLADGAIATVIGHGIKVMVLAFLVSVTFPLINLFVAPANPQWSQLIAMATGMTALACLCLFAPRLAVGMLLHAPQLSAGVFAASMIGGMWVAGRGWDAARSALPSRRTQGNTQMPPQRSGAPQRQPQIRPQSP